MARATCRGPTRGRFRVDVDRALRGIEARLAPSVQAATSMWALDRGWCHALAERAAVSDIGFVTAREAYAASGSESSAAALMRWADGRLVVPLHYPDGQAWGVATADDHEAGWSIHSRDDPGPPIVGSVPASVERCDDATPLVVAPDPLVALAVGAAGHPVVGGLDADRMSSVLAAVQDRIAETDVELAVVVLATDEDSAQRVARAAAERVVGATEARWGLLRGWSAAAVQAAIDGARLAPGAPLPLDDARLELTQRLERLADPAHPDAATLTTLELVIADTGVGKSYAIDRVAAGRQRRGDRVGVLTTTVEATGEHAARIADEGGAHMVVKGALKQCAVYEAAPSKAQAAIRRRFESGGRAALCEGCPEKKRGCPGAEAPRLAPRVVSLAAHQSAESLCRPPPKNAPPERPGLLFIDECPRTIEDRDPTPASRLHELLSCPEGAKWRAAMGQDEGETLSAVIPGLDTAAAHLRDTHGLEHAIRWPLVHALDEQSSLASWLGENVECPWAVPPDCGWPTPDEVRADGAQGHPDEQAVSLVIATVEAVAAARAGHDAPEQYGGIDMRVDASGWALEWSTPLSLPTLARVIIADATAEHRLAEYEAVAKHNGRTLRVHRIQAQATRSVECVHVAGQCFRGPELRTRINARGKRRLKASAPPSIRRAFVLGLVPLVLRLPRDRRISIGVLSNKQLAAALRCEDNSSEGAEIASMVRQLEGLGFDLDVGHFGAHDTGTNRWGSADVLFILGDGSEELGEARRQARILGVDAATMYDGRLTAALVQRVGRARLLQRLDDPPCVVVAATRVAPVPAVQWVERGVSRGNAPSLDSLSVALSMAEMCRDVGFVDSPGVAHRYRVSYRFVRKHLSEIADAMGMVRWSGHVPGQRGRPPKRYCFPGHQHQRSRLGNDGERPPS